MEMTRGLKCHLCLGTKIFKAKKLPLKACNKPLGSQAIPTPPSILKGAKQVFQTSNLCSHLPPLGTFKAGSKWLTSSYISAPGFTSTQPPPKKNNFLPYPPYPLSLSSKPPSFFARRHRRALQHHVRLQAPKERLLQQLQRLQPARSQNANGLAKAGYVGAGALVQPGKEKSEAQADGVYGFMKCFGGLMLICLFDFWVFRRF